MEGENLEVESFFKEMFDCIWQGNDLGRFEEFYAKNFTETIGVSDQSNQPIEFQMNYEELLEEAKKNSQEYENTTFEIKKIVSGEENHISVNFYSTSIVKATGEKRHRLVCGIWRLNAESKIDRVWAVVTPNYS